MNRNRIKIGLDFHGVVSSRPQYFAEFSRQVLALGYELHIITGGPADVVDKMLKEWQVRYTNLFAILDYYDAKGEVEYYDNGEFKVPEKLWNSAKGEYCMAKGINLHIDDSMQYARWFMTPYCIYDKEKQICKTDGNFAIDFSGDPETAVKQIQKIVNSCQYF